jgi:hypothetical protein
MSQYCENCKRLADDLAAANAMIVELTTAYEDWLRSDGIFPKALCDLVRKIRTEPHQPG